MTSGHDVGGVCPGLWQLSCGVHIIGRYLSKIGLYNNVQENAEEKKIFDKNVIYQLKLKS